MHFPTVHRRSQGQSSYPVLISSVMLFAVSQVVTENRIRELCAEAVSASDEDCERIVAKLRDALSTHIRFLRDRTKEMQERERVKALTRSAA